MSAFEIPQLEERSVMKLSEFARAIEYMPIPHFFILLARMGVPQCPICRRRIERPGRNDSQGRPWCHDCCVRFDAIDWEEVHNRRGDL